MKRVYLDYASTTPVLPEVFESMKPFFSDQFGNASSLHDFGFTAQVALDEARQRVAQFLGTDKENIVFTSGGTESNNLAIQGSVFNLRLPRPHIITSAIEHSSVYNTCRFLEERGCELTVLPVDRSGFVSASDVKAAIKDHTVLISIHYANNEIGTIQPIRQIGEIVDQRDIIFHVDAVQAFGKVPIDIDGENISLLSVSAHKIYGPKGVGFLFINQSHMRRIVKQSDRAYPERILRPLMYGGPHEMGLRPSTENIPGIVGLGTAVELAAGPMAQEAIRQQQLRDYFIDAVLQNIPGTTLNGARENRMPNNINLCFAGVSAYELMLLLDGRGIACSSGSACSAQSEKPSRVLTAIGLSDADARSSLRFTLGRFTTQSDIDYVVENLPATIKRLKSDESIHGAA
jgi:cysteine desulfurase